MDERSVFEESETSQNGGLAKQSLGRRKTLKDLSLGS